MTFMVGLALNIWRQYLSWLYTWPSRLAWYLCLSWLYTWPSRLAWRSISILIIHMTFSVGLAFNIRYLYLWLYQSNYNRLISQTLNQGAVVRNRLGGVIPDLPSSPLSSSNKSEVILHVHHDIGPRARRESCAGDMELILPVIPRFLIQGRPARSLTPRLVHRTLPGVR